MKIDEIREYVDNIANFVASKRQSLNLLGTSGLLSDIINKEVKFLVFLTFVYLITLIVKQRSKTMYKYLVSLTIAVIAIFTFKVSTVFDESIKNGNPTPEVIKGLPPLCIYIVIKLFQIIPPLKLVYYTLPIFMIAYSIYHNISSNSQKSLKSSKSSKSPKKHSSQSSSHSKTKSKNEKSLKDFLFFGLSISTDIIHSFYLFYAYVVLVLLIFINNNFEYTINSMNSGSNLYGKILNIIDIPFLNVKNTNFKKN